MIYIHCTCTAPSTFSHSRILLSFSVLSNTSKTFCLAMNFKNRHALSQKFVIAKLVFLSTYMYLCNDKEFISSFESKLIIRDNFSLWQSSYLVFRYLLQNTNMNWTVKKKVHVHVIFVNSSQNEGLSSSGIALSFDWFGSILWHSICFYPTALSFFTFFLNFQLFWPEHD
jgi:hypothetical protein